MTTASSNRTSLSVAIAAACALSVAALADDQHQQQPAAPAAAPDKPKQPAPADTKPLDTKPSEAKPSDPKPAELKSPGLLSPEDAPGPEVLKRTRMPSGLIIDDLKIGEGMPCLPNANISFHAKGWVRGQANPFDDTTVKREAVGNTPALDGNPIAGPISKLLPGMRDGVIGMQPGGKRRLFIPAALAYSSFGRTDAEGNQVVPSNADLVYEINLVEIRQRLVKPGENADEAKKSDAPAATPAPAPDAEKK